MTTPFAWGQSNAGPGFSDYLKQTGYRNENDIISLLPRMDPVQQVRMDITLNMNGIDAFPDHSNLLISDSKWKHRLIPVFQGKERNPRLIQLLIDVVKRGIASHRNRIANQLTGSAAWNEVWLAVYKQWLNRLHKILGEING